MTLKEAPEYGKHEVEVEGVKLAMKVLSGLINVGGILKEVDALSTHYWEIHS